MLSRRILPLALLFCATAQAQAPPNIVWIWADNLAYQDLGAYGSDRVKTPVIDGLARDGVKLNQYYVAHVVCSPSRAALLTGRQPFRAGIVDVLRPDGPSGLPSDELTLAEAMRERGYRTMAVGKWHLGDRREYLPLQHGFDAGSDCRTRWTCFRRCSIATTRSSTGWTATRFRRSRAA